MGFGGVLNGTSEVLGVGTGKIQPELLSLLRLLSALSTSIGESRKSRQLSFCSSPGIGESIYGVGFGGSNEGHAVMGVGELVSFSFSTLGAGLVATEMPAKGLRSLNEGDFGAWGYGEGGGSTARLSVLKADPLNALDVRGEDEIEGERVGREDTKGTDTKEADTEGVDIGGVDVRGGGTVDVSNSPNSSSFPVASAVASNSTSLTGIDLGGWGSGKTWLRRDEDR